jgi:hypothetical protein
MGGMTLVDAPRHNAVSASVCDRFEFGLETL